MSDQLNVPHAAGVARKYLFLYSQFNISERYKKANLWVISRMLVDVSGKIIEMGFHPTFWGVFPPAANVMCTPEQKSSSEELGM